MKEELINVLMIGDIIGEPGRKAIFLHLSGLIKSYNADFVVANGENAAGGFGITSNIAHKLHSYGVDCITSGNHIWRNKDVFQIIDRDNALLRPLNFPNGTPGKGWTILEKNNKRLAVVNLMGRVFMEPIDCPFRVIKKELTNLKKLARCIVIDFHGEATSEKMAMGWFLDGHVSAVVGTHTHVQTADNRILKNGTAYISDLGLTGSYDSVIGMDKDKAVRKFVTMMPTRFSVATENVHINGVNISIDYNTGKAVSIERFDIQANVI